MGESTVALSVCTLQLLSDLLPFPVRLRLLVDSGGGLLLFSISHRLLACYI